MLDRAIWLLMLVIFLIAIIKQAEAEPLEAAQAMYCNSAEDLAIYVKEPQALEAINEAAGETSCARAHLVFRVEEKVLDVYTTHIVTIYKVRVMAIITPFGPQQVANLVQYVAKRGVKLTSA